MTRQAIDQRAALALQLAMIAGDEPAGSVIEIRSKRSGVGMAQQFIGVRELSRARAAIQNLSQRTDVFVGAAPRVREAGTVDAVERVWCLWADVDGRESLERLAAFKPGPSIVIRTGGADRVHAWWPLQKPISPEWAKRANRRLSLALSADRNATDAARVLRPAGTWSYKYEPRRPVLCTRLELDAFTAAQVVGGLADDPSYRLLARRPAAITSPATIVGLVQSVRRAVMGNRNSTLYWAACCLRDDGLDAEESRDALLAAALEAGLGEYEASRTIQSALDAGSVAA